MEPQQDNLDLSRYLETVIRWWWVLVIVPVIAGALAYYQANRQTPMYRASADILVQQARSGLIGPGDTGANSQLASNYSKLATTSGFSKRVQQELGLNRAPNIGASGIGSVLRVSVQDPDPLVARDAANKLAELLILDIQTNQVRDISRLEALAKAEGISVSREILQARLSTIDSLRLIESAVIPGGPFAPKPKRNAVFGGMLGLMLGGVLVFLLEFFNNNIRSVEQTEQLLGASATSSTIGVIFFWSHKEVNARGLVVRNHSSSPYAEMFRQLRTGFQFVRALHDSKALLITSALPLEGKTTVAANLATVLAQGGSRVILVDADLRRPSLHRIFNLQGASGENDHQGLCGLLVGPTLLASQALVEVGIGGLKVLPSGLPQQNSADLLTSERAKAIFEELRGQCDILLVDSPPVMPVADPVILARYVDGVILTVALGQTRTDAFRDAVNQIQRSGTPVIGYVMNKVKSRRLGSGRYYYYYSNYARREEAELTDGMRRPTRRWYSTNGVGSFVSQVVGRFSNRRGRKK